jgi:mannose-6-phosphate isomerase-like protein (cupin superfamily)
MIQRAGNMDVEIRERMKEGKGAIEVTHLLRQIQLKGKCRFFGSMLIKPGCSIGLHRHDEEEEIYYIVKGEGMAEDNGIRQPIKAGDVMLTGNGASHSIENTGKDDLVVLGIILLY